MVENTKMPNMLALADVLVEDILNMTDEEILAEAKEDGVDIKADSARIKGLFKAAAADAAKAKLRAAQAGLRQKRSEAQVLQLHPPETVARYERALKAGTTGSAPLTMAARSGGDMSERDKQKLIEDMIALGIKIPDEQ